MKDVIDHEEYYPKFVRCMKRKTLRALDRCLSPDVVPLADGVNLVRFELVDHSGNVLHDNVTRYVQCTLQLTTVHGKLPGYMALIAHKPILEF